MDLYTKVAYKHAKSLTLSYSTSFGLSSRLFDKSIRKHIYAIYALVRIADEVVDTYKQKDAQNLLDELEDMVYAGILSGYSTNPVVHAFCATAIEFNIEKEIIKPFFISMRLDLQPQTYTSELFDRYVYGSAEVVGLMCLRVFCCGDNRQYLELKSGAKKLGSAYQKVNFLRDLKADFESLGRSYFPQLQDESFDDKIKNILVNQISEEFKEAHHSIVKLPSNSKAAVYASYRYYVLLLNKLEKSSARDIKNTRIRINNFQKLFVLSKVYLKSKFGLL